MSMRRRCVLALATVALIVILAWWHWRASAPSDTTGNREQTDLAAQLRVKGSAQAMPQIRVGLLRPIAGTVLFDNAPLRGATVRLVSEASTAGLTPELRVLTDESGRFDFGPQRSSEYIVVAEMPHLTAAMQTVDPRDPSDASQLHLVLHACDASIYGKVRDSSGGLIAKAHVAWTGPGEFATAGTDAGDDGSYDLCVPVAGAETRATAAGYAMTSETLTAYGRVHHDFELSPEAAVHGRVVRADDHAPVRGAIVELQYEGMTYRAPLHVSSDGDGRFHLEGVTPGPYVLTANAARLATAEPTNVFAEVGGSQDEVICTVVPTLRVSGKLIEHGTGAPIEGATLSLFPRDFDSSSRRLEALTQADGSFQIETAVSGEFNPALTGADFASKPQPFRVANADIDGLVIEAERLASVSGRVTRGGKPVDGVQVSVPDSQISTLSDHEGRFTLRGIKAGSHRLYAESKRVGAFTNGPTVTLGKGEQKSGIELDLDLAASISGTVVDQSGVPASGLVVRFSLLHGTDWGVATTSEDGTFTARALSGGGDYVYEVTRREGEAALRPADGKRYSTVAVRDSQSRITGLRIRVRIEHLSIAGRVIDTAGKPVSDATITAARRDRYPPYVAMTDTNGSFAIRDVETGTYDVGASTARGDQHVPDVGAGRTDVLIRLAALGSIEGTVDGFTAVPRISARRMDYGWRSYEATTSGRSFVVSNLPAGQYVVTATSPSGADNNIVIVSPGSPAKLALHAQSLGAIEGTLIDERTHAPITDAYCASQVDELHLSGHATSDEYGTFRMSRAPAGNNHVTCFAGRTMAQGSVVVTANQTVHIDLIGSAVPDRPRGHAGLVVESPLGFQIVLAVEPNGPAARAGIQVGDVLLEAADENSPAAYGGGTLQQLENHPPGTVVKVTIERGDKVIEVTLTLDAAP